MDYTNFISGASSGIITKTLTSPLDRMKILYQTNNKVIVYESSLIRNIRNVYETQGCLSFYRGNGVNIAKIVPAYSLKFTFNDYFRKLLWGRTTDLSLQQMMYSGVFTGISLISILYPLDVVRTRFSVSPNSLSLPRYSLGVLKTEGVKGFYKGLRLSLLTGSTHISIQMSSYDMYKSQIEQKSVFSNLLCGAAAGITSQAIVYPGDLIRKKLHIDGSLSKSKTYTNTFDCIRQTLLHQGIRGFYRGIPISILKTIPSSAIQFSSYDYIKNLFRSD
tara:strand:- start:75 stop:902 length:828 start_codon:yes stop_codon:yes gene_type:complete